MPPARWPRRTFRSRSSARCSGRSASPARWTWPAWRRGSWPSDSMAAGRCELRAAGGLVADGFALLLLATSCCYYSNEPDPDGPVASRQSPALLGHAGFDAPRPDLLKEYLMERRPNEL